MTKTLRAVERAGKYQDYEEVGRALGTLGAYMSYMLRRIAELEQQHTRHASRRARSGKGKPSG